jgi:hypothetical protein
MEDIWDSIQFPKIVGKLNEEKYANKKRDSLISDILDDKPIDYDELEEMKNDKEFRTGLPEPKTIAQDLISVTPISKPNGALYNNSKS